MPRLLLLSAVLALIVIIGAGLAAAEESKQSEWEAAGENEGDWTAQGRGSVQDRMQVFKQAVCNKCNRRGVNCGCETTGEGEHNLFAMLADYAQRYEGWRRSVKARDVEEVERLRWVLVRVHMGAGNQHLQLVGGLMMALAMQRGLVVSWDSFIQYPFDSVLSLLTLEELTLGGVNTMDLQTVILERPEDARTIACSNWNETFTGVVVDFVSDYTIHIPLLNPHVGDLLNKAFLGVPFFFLSHYIWSGSVQRGGIVRVRRSIADISGQTVLPGPGLESPGIPGQGGKAQRREVVEEGTLEDALDAIGGAGKGRGLVVGMHVRTATNRAGFYHDQTHFLPRDAGSFCSGGDMSGLMSMMTCLRGLIGALPPSLVTVLWATDNDELSAGLLEAVKEVASVVQIVHDLSDRHDVGCWHVEGVACSDLGLRDLELLSEGDALITSPGSTYSFMAHARGLIRPHIGSFFGDRGTCPQAAGTEAGLLMRDPGGMHDGCQVQGRVLRCERSTQGCVSTMASHFKMGGCLQEVLQCARLRFEEEVLDVYIAEMSHSTLLQSWMARFGYSFEAPYPHIEMPACTDAATIRMNDARKRTIDLAAPWHRASASLGAAGDWNEDLGWSVRPGSVGAYAFDGPQELLAINIQSNGICGSGEMDMISLWYTEDDADPHNGHETRDATNLLVKAKWIPLIGSHNYDGGRTTLVIGDEAAPRVAATALKLRVDELCGTHITSVQIWGVPLSLLSESGNASALSWSSIQERRQKNAEAFDKSEGEATHVRILAPANGSEIPRHLEKGETGRVFLRVRVLKGVVMKYLEQQEGAHGMPEEFNGTVKIAVRLNGNPFSKFLDVTCDDDTRAADPMEACQASMWLTVTLGSHMVSVALAQSEVEWATNGDAASFQVVPWTHVSQRMPPDVLRESTDLPMSKDSSQGVVKGLEGQTVVFSTVSANLMNLIYHIRAWQKWCVDDFQFIAVLNHSPARGGRFRIRDFNPEGVRMVCKELGVSLVEVTFDVGGVENHQILLEWVWQNLVLPRYAGKHVYVALTESDVFPIDYFSISSFLENGTCAVGGKNLGIDGVRYVHPGFSYFAMHVMPHPERWCFVGLDITLDGHQNLLDTGGCSYLYLNAFQTSDNASPPTTFRPSHMSEKLAAGIHAFYAWWARKVDDVDPIGISAVFSESPAYRDFASRPPGMAAVKACWLRQHPHDSRALEALPLDCRDAFQGSVRTPIQETYCSTAGHDDVLDLFQGGQPVGGPFVHVGCGSGWCGAYDSVALHITKLARADAWLQYVQVLYGCECVHCSVAQKLKRIGFKISTDIFLRQTRCGPVGSDAFS